MPTGSWSFCDFVVLSNFLYNVLNKKADIRGIEKDLLPQREFID